VNVTNLPSRPAPMLARTITALSALSGGRVLVAAFPDVRVQNPTPPGAGDRSGRVSPAPYRSGGIKQAEYCRNGYDVVASNSDDFDGNSPALASSYALVRPMPRIQAAVSTSVVMSRLRTASVVHTRPSKLACRCRPS
jgi:hypothetical protein